MFSVALLLLLAAGSRVKCEQLTQPAFLTVQPGQPLTITCQVSYSVGSHYTAWIRQPAGKGLEWIGMKYTGDTQFKDSLKNKFSISLDSSSNTVTLKGQNLQPEDTAVYYCARDGTYYAFDYWGKGTMVTVTSATSTGPSVFPLIQCGSGTGDMLTLGCLATGFTPASLTFTWADHSGAALTDFVQYPAVDKDSKYTAVSQIQVKRADWENKKAFKCVASHPAGDRDIIFEKIDVYYHLPTLNVLSSSPEEVKNKKTTSFSCFAIDFSPKQHEIKWLRNGEEINDKISELKTSPVESNKNANGSLFSTASYLEVNDSAWMAGKSRYTCVFTIGKQHESVNESVIHTEETTACDNSDQLIDVNIIPLSLEEMFFNKRAELVCEVTVKQPPIQSVEWQDETGRSLIGRRQETTQGGQKKISVAVDILYEEWSKGIDYYCVVEHDDLLEPKKIRFERKNGGMLTRPEVFLLHPVEQTKMVTLTCYVKDFYPKEVVVSWLVNDMAADSNDYASKTTNLVENNGYFSIYGQLLFSYDQWKKNGVVYSCVVYHESMMNTTRIIVRSMVERTSDKPNLVNLNMNLPETCKA